jgi:hypothetical protein
VANKEFLLKMKNVPEEVKDAVIEKWLNYCKCHHINQSINWRLKIFLHEFNYKEH